jgi:hypothetical protein
MMALHVLQYVGAVRMTYFAAQRSTARRARTRCACSCNSYARCMMIDVS